MLKKLVIGSVAVAALGSFVLGRDAVQYLKTCGRTVRNAVKAEVPIEFQIETAKNMIADLTPDVNESLHQICEREVEIDQLRQEIESAEKGLTTQQSTLLSLSNDVKSGRTELKYSGRVYTVSEVQKDLANRFSRYKVADETLNRKKQTLASREQALAGQRRKLEGLLGAKKDLELQIEQLQARLSSIEAAQTVSDLQLDDSQLTRAKALIQEVNKELLVRERMLDAEGKFQNLINVDEPTAQIEVPRDIAEQVQSFFGETPAGTGVAAVVDGI